ncbi:hypothetical protein BUGL105410_36320 [Burkholderia gladioli]
MKRRETLASVQWVATRTTSTPASIANSMSVALPSPGMKCTPSQLVVSAARAVSSIRTSSIGVWPSRQDEPPSPLPWPTSTMSMPAALAARA